jgi:2-dehydro-3-deoxygluconokinase
MAGLEIKSAAECRWDILSLGEVMLRLDPGEGRVRNTRQFRVWEGGGEYNVARGLRRCFGQRASVVTAVPQNDLGRLLEDLMLQGGVDLSHLVWRPYDGIGRASRQGLNFTERGFGLRGAKGVSDRAHTAASELKRGEVDWDSIFGGEGVRWFHTGGIFAALSETTAETVIEAMEAAKRHGTVVSYDLNYRPSLWKAIGGPQKAQEVNKRIAPLVDVMIGNEEDFTACLGFEVEGLDESITGIKLESFKAMIAKAVAAYPNFKAVATTLRDVVTATVNHWSAVLWHDGEFFKAAQRDSLEIFDRVGGGDSFASGLIYGFLAGKGAAAAVEYGAAHGALAMTTPGDTTMASLDEVEKLVAGGSARVDR